MMSVASTGESAAGREPSDKEMLVNTLRDIVLLTTANISAVEAGVAVGGILPEHSGRKPVGSLRAKRGHFYKQVTAPPWPPRRALTRAAAAEGAAAPASVSE
jgi:hypothetical protein